MNDVTISKSKSGFSAVWLVPVVAVVMGLWMVVQNIMNEGPTIEIEFATAEGLKAGETKVKRLSVDMGVVEQVYLNDDYKSVTALVKLEKSARDLLREDTEFWVVKPRVGTDGVSGLSTLLSGAYLELSPGSGVVGRRHYVGLESPPVTSADHDGLRLKLTADRMGSMSVGSPVIYNGYRVGKVESAELSAHDGKAYYAIFIRAPYDDLVTTNTRFWNASGLNVEAGSEGIAVHTESFEALLMGGIAFGLPEGSVAGQPVQNDTLFTLFSSEKMSAQVSYEYAIDYLLLFDASIRGLQPGAPVNYRGARIGTVASISPDLVDESKGWNDAGHALMPVLIRIEPGRFGSASDTEQGLAEADALIRKTVSNGLRASLSTGNLLTGSLYVDLDFYRDVEPVTLTDIGPWTVLPTTSSGLGQIEAQVTQLLQKIESMPLEQAVVAATTALKNVGQAMKTADRTLGGVNVVLENPDTRALPASLNATIKELDQFIGSVQSDTGAPSQLGATLVELQATLRKAGAVLEQLDDKPNSLIFSGARKNDPRPTRK